MRRREGLVMLGMGLIVPVGSVFGKGPKTYRPGPDVVEGGDGGSVIDMDYSVRKEEDGGDVKVVRMRAQKAHAENREQVGVRGVVSPGFVRGGFWEGERRLLLRRVATGQQEWVCYAKDNELMWEGYAKACEILKDVSGRQAVQMDVRLLDVLAALQGYFHERGSVAPLNVLSGFRSLKTNDALEGAAKNSMHLYGRAADVYMGGVAVKDLMQVSKHFKVGGVGFYPERNFLHLDTGLVRVWKG